MLRKGLRRATRVHEVRLGVTWHSNGAVGSYTFDDGKFTSLLLLAVTHCSCMHEHQIIDLQNECCLRVHLLGRRTIIIFLVVSASSTTPSWWRGGDYHKCASSSGAPIMTNNISAAAGYTCSSRWFKVILSPFRFNCRLIVQNFVLIVVLNFSQWLLKEILKVSLLYSLLVGFNKFQRST